MSESTVRTASVNPTPATTNPESQVPTTAAPAATPAADAAIPSPEVTAATPAVQQSAEQAAEAAAEREAELREEAAKTLTACGRVFARGERAHRDSQLEAGRLAGVYITQRLTLGDKRAAAVDLLTLELSRYASSTVDVNRLVLTYHAHRLLAVEQSLAGSGKKAGPADSVPYGLYRDQWCRLVERTAKDTPQEGYALLPGLEADCLAAFAKAVQDTLSRDAVTELVSGIVARYAKAQAERNAAAAEEAKKARIAEAAKLNAAAEQLRAAEKAKADAEAAAKANGDAQTAAAVQQAAEELAAKQRALVEQQAAAEKAAAEAKAAERKAKADQERVAKAAQKAAKAAEQADKPAAKGSDPKAGDGKANPADGRGVVTGNLLRMAESGTVKDVAGMVVELITGTGKPEAVLEEVLRQLKAGGHVHKRAVGAIDAALLILSRKDMPKQPAGPSPVEVANRLAQPGTPAPVEQLNGQPAPAAA
jgi:hypothetical protein